MCPAPAHKCLRQLCAGAPLYYATDMRVLACDPGYERLGVAVMERMNGVDTLLYSSCIITKKLLSPADRLHEVGRAFKQLLTKHTPEYVAIETLFFNKNQKTALAVAEVRGALTYLARASGATVREYSPQQIKIAVTGHGASNKRQVIAMVRCLVPEAPERALDDEYDAIALALTALTSEKTLSTY